MAYTPADISIPYVGPTEYGDDADVPDLSEAMALRLHDLIYELQQARDAMAQFLVPVGTIVPYGGTTAPNGWKLCNGSAHSSDALQALLGSADTPDLTGRFIVGAGASTKHPYTNLYNRGAGAAGPTSYQRSISANEMPVHSHPNSFDSEGTVGASTLSFASTGHQHYHVPSIMTDGVNGLWHANPHYGLPFNAGDSTWSMLDTPEVTAVAMGAVGMPQRLARFITYSSTPAHSSGGMTTRSITMRNGNAGSGALVDFRPPHYALVYIIKTGPGTVNGVPYIT